MDENQAFSLEYMILKQEFLKHLITKKQRGSQ